MPAKDRPLSAPEGTYPPEPCPVDVERTDVSGNVDIEQIRSSLFLTPAERLRRLEEFAEFVLAARRKNRVPEWSDSRSS
jgi:hypothetical protein